MLHSDQNHSPAGRLLQAALLLALFIYGSAAVNAQNAAHDAAAVPASAQSAGNTLSPAAAEGIGDARLVERRYQEAIEAYKKASNDSSDVWNKRGISYQMLSDLDDATRCYKESLRLDPKNEKAINNLATIYDALGDHRKAERMYRQALKLDPDSPVFLMDLGTNLVVQDKYDQSAKFFQRAFLLDQEVFDNVAAPTARNSMSAEQSGAINYYKAKGFAQAGMIDQAIQSLRRAIDAGFISPRKVGQDNSFAPLRSNPRFQQMLSEQGE